jgi:CO/xanthine dehydrogenase FAD-binding subunit
MQHRVEASESWTNTNDWKTERRHRTRHLIELGGLVQKAGLIELTDDDRAVLLGAFVRLAEILSGDEGARFSARCRERGKHAFREREARK